MPWLSGDNHTRRRYSRASSGSQKPLSQSPAVNLSTSPSQAKKNSNASEAKLRPLNRTKGKSTSSTASLSPTASKPNQDHATEVQHKPELGVFAYMEDDDEEAENRRIEDEHGDDGPNSSGSNTMASSPVSTHHPNSHYSDLEVNADPEFKRQTWHGGFDPVDSFNSDSGVSMGSSSGEGDSPIFQHKYPSIRRVSRLSASSLEPSIPEHYGLNVSPEPFTAQTPNLGSDPWPQDNPETYYRSAKYHPPENIAPVCQMPVTPPELSPQLPRTKNKAPASDFSKRQGYARLASTISSHDDAVLKPIYRKFDTLNNRILLYLQDEISELEAELEELDEGIARELHYLGKNHRQASRRAEARAPSALQMRRIELMGRCAGKIDIYNRTLGSYSTLTQKLSPACHSDITAYRKWVVKHAQIVEPELAFLQLSKDLLTVSRHANSFSPTDLKHSPVTISLTILTTIFVFKFVPQFMARLVMSGVIGLALMCMVSPGSLMDLKLLREKRRGIGAYAGVMLMLAIVVD